MNLAEDDALLAVAAPKQTECIDGFLDFLHWLNVVPQPGQAEFCRVAYDGREPLDRPLAERIFGAIEFDSLPVGVRDVVVAVCGGRGGKSYLLVALRLVWGMLVRDLSPLAPGQQAYATVVAPNEKLRQEVVNYALGACRSKPELRELLRLPRGTRDDDIVSEFSVYRADCDKLVTFSAATATRGGYAVRGRWHTDLALDEAAFFRDSSYKINDEEIFKAGKPRVLPGGQTIIASTPWAEAGILYEMWRDNFGKPSTALVAHAPTLLLNDTSYTRQIVEAERKRDPDNAKREYDAAFMTTGTTVFFEAASVDASLTDEVFARLPGDNIRAGGDFAFRSDSSALIKVAARGGVLHVFGGVECRPEDGKPLVPSRTVEAFAGCIAGDVGYLMADGHYREAIAEHLDKHKLAYAPAPVHPVDTYVRARMLFRENRIRIHRPNLPEGMAERMVRQLREVHGKPTSGGGMSIVHQHWARGGHGDIVAALVLALWQLSGDDVPAPKPVEGTKEHEEAMREQRRRAATVSQGKPWWQRSTGEPWQARFGR